VPDETAAQNESHPAVPDKSGHEDVPKTSPQVRPNASKSGRDRREKPRHSMTRRPLSCSSMSAPRSPGASSTSA
jgi:hypothetical protein